jgi:hypothetical protein
MASVFIGLIVGGALVITTSGNRWVADELQGFRVQQETTDAAISSGFLDLVADRSSLIVTRLPGGNEYYNDAYVSWRGGPKDVVYDTAVPESAYECGNLLLCTSEEIPLFHLREFIDDTGTLLIAVARVAAATDDPVNPLVRLDQARVFGPAGATPSCAPTGHDDSEQYGGWKIRLCEGPPATMSALVDLVASASSFDPSPNHATVDAAIHSGFFDRVPDNALINKELSGPFSPSYFAWRGGPSNLIFTNEIPKKSEPCSDVQVCTPDGRSVYSLRNTATADGSSVLILAPVATMLPKDQLIIIDHTTLFGREDVTPLCDLSQPNRSLAEMSTDRWTIRHCSGPPTALSTMIQWVRYGCDPGIEAWPPCQDTSDK